MNLPTIFVSTHMIYVCDIGMFKSLRHEAQRVCMRDFEVCEVYVYSQ